MIAMPHNVCIDAIVFINHDCHFRQSTNLKDMKKFWYWRKEKKLTAIRKVIKYARWKYWL